MRASRTRIVLGTYRIIRTAVGFHTLLIGANLSCHVVNGVRLAGGTDKVAANVVGGAAIVDAAFVGGADNFIEIRAGVIPADHVTRKRHELADEPEVGATGVGGAAIISRACSLLTNFRKLVHLVSESTHRTNETHAAVVTFATLLTLAEFARSTECSGSVCFEVGLTSTIVRFAGRIREATVACITDSALANLGIKRVHRMLELRAHKVAAADGVTKTTIHVHTRIGNAPCASRARLEVIAGVTGVIRPANRICRTAIFCHTHI